MAIVLVACVSRKRTSPVPAADLYQSDWFLKARAYVDHIGARWFILSAAYGLVEPHRPLAPYNTSLLAMTPSERRQWGENVVEQLHHAIAADDRDPIVFLAGRLYREPLLAFAGDRAVIPMLGMGIGQQKQWLAQQIRTRPPSPKAPGSTGHPAQVQEAASLHHATRLIVRTLA